ncbi:oxidoreductase [Pseudomonas benzenivorans]|uniref:Oxidoreductase n=1 Tax=Pseudomonas benzenivorans TaxID=556533 RepID=A0ABY5H8H1_9PSED|nr:oxidoreductase [Pseudomonas benzenivorans]UTW08137.1 oxidoreductase [Pseudomonas benzenivorans]
MFKALLVSQVDGAHTAELVQLKDSDLSGEGVLVQVDYSGLNYKDALAVTGQGKIVRKFPLVPGVDFSGTVLQSSSPDYCEGDAVVSTGWEAGVSHFGGYAQRAWVPADWLVKLPVGLTLQQAMALGTAGVTAMLSILELEEGHVLPSSGPVVVTGASGGVGSIAVALLSALGYHVAAVTGRQENHDYLRKLGATEVVPREDMAALARPLESQKWAGAIDCVGGSALSRILAETAEGGVVTCCGLAASPQLSTTLMPFILRGLRLVGIESVRQPKQRRLHVWKRLAETMPLSLLDSLTETIALESLTECSRKLLSGGVTGRVLVDLRS